MNRLGINQRLVAFTCVATLLFSWTHIHSEAHSESPSSDAREIAHSISEPHIENPQLSSDDAHHQHSSTTTQQVEPCLVCRSQSNIDCDRPADNVHPTIHVTGRMTYPALAPQVVRAPAREGHPPRAPPAFRSLSPIHT